MEGLAVARSDKVGITHELESMILEFLSNLNGSVIKNKDLNCIRTCLKFDLFVIQRVKDMHMDSGRQMKSRIGFCSLRYTAVSKLATKFDIIKDKVVSKNTASYWSNKLLE